MNRLSGIRLAVLSNVHKVHDGRLYYREAWFAAQHGMRVSVLAIDDGCKAQHTEVRAFPASSSRFRRFLLGWRLAYIAFRGRFDIFHFHDPEMLLPMTLLHLITGKPVIYDCHENVVDSIYHKRYIPRSFRAVAARFTFWVQWLCAKVLGSVIVATSEQLEMFPASIRHAVVRNFPPLHIQSSLDDQADRPYDIVHCGNLSRERGSHVLFESLRCLVHDFGRRDCTLLLVGVTSQQLDPDLKRYLVDNDIERNVEFRGHVPLHDVPNALVSAKIGIMCHQETSQYRYGVASKLFDYMAAGLAVVGGFADFDREYAPEGEVKIYVDQTKPHDYAAAMHRLLIDVEARQRMSRNARELFQQKYTAEAQAGELIRFYETHFPVRCAA